MTVTLYTTPVLMSQLRLESVALAPQTSTDANGLYTFTNVANGTYFAHFDLPNGYLVSPLAVGLNPATGDSTDFIVSQTNSNITVNAPLVQKPTAIELAAFSADAVSAAKCANSSGADCVRLTWQTLSESFVAGFKIVRSDGSREAAVEVGQDILPASGMAAQYSIVDANTQPGKTYIYWLVEINTAGFSTDIASVVAHVDGSVADAPMLTPVVLRLPLAPRLNK